MTNLRLTLITAVALLVCCLSSCSSSDEGAKGAADDPQPVNRTFTASPYPYVYDGSGANVKRSQFGKKWPLTVKSGRVNCIRTGGTGVAVAFTADNGKKYALNGTAKGSENKEVFGFVDVDPIWADNPDVPGTKKDIGVLIDVCQPYME